MSSRFARDTAVTRLDDHRFGATMDRGWWIVRGPNGGYVAAVVLRAFTEAVGDGSRAPRSLTIHFLAPPEEGEVVMETTIERRGRSLVFLSGRLLQGDRLCATALAAFSPPWPGPSFADLPMPAAPAPPDAGPSLARLRREAAAAAEGSDPGAPSPASPPPLFDRYDMIPVLGAAPFAAATEAFSGGWIRLAEPAAGAALDAPLVAAITDAWVPAVFSRVGTPLAVPTVDLTVHFRVPLPHPGVATDDHVLAQFRTRTLVDGFLEEDGDIWAADGTLLAQSRQLAVALPLG